MDAGLCLVEISPCQPKTIMGMGLGARLGPSRWDQNYEGAFQTKRNLLIAPGHCSSYRQSRQHTRSKITCSNHSFIHTMRHRWNKMYVVCKRLRWFAL